MFCSKCGSQVADNAAFCPTCGNSTGAQGTAPRGIPVAPGAFPPPAMTPSGSYGSSAVQAPVYAAPVAQPIRWAGFWLRFVAWFIDSIILQIASTFIVLPFAVSTGIRDVILNHPPQSPAEIIALFGSLSKLIVISACIKWLYYALLESSAWQATIGKKTLGLEVTDLEGHRISFARATGRYFAKIISVLTFLIGYIMAGFTEKKQALHDMIAGCLVIRKI